MSKRTLAEQPSAPEPERRRVDGAQPMKEEEGMGEFEDPFEDEIESDGEIVHHEDDDMDEEDDEPETQTKPFMPGTMQLEEGQTLVPDQSAYHMLHRMNVTWPCLSFDFLRDHLGSQRQSMPHTAYVVAGTQADTAKNNEVLVIKASSMHRTQHDDGIWLYERRTLLDAEKQLATYLILSEPSHELRMSGTNAAAASDDDDQDDDVDEDAVLEYKTIPHLGGVNRVRAAPTTTPTSDLEPCLDAYPVATWSETGKVHIWDVRPLFNALNVPGTTIDKKKIETPLFTVNTHRTEGFAMDWGGLLGGGASGYAGHLRLLTGDMHSKIFLTTSNNTGFTTHATPFESHTSSVEDLQWSPTEPTVFASCSADRSIRIWDVRIKSHRSALTVDAAHEQDVNVISWNRGTQFLLLSGGDDGALNVWDMRSFKPNQTPSPVAHFDWHRAPISSVEWHPEEDSIFAASGRDDQVTLWDLGVERDDEEDPAQLPKGPNGQPVPSQLLFCHHGASDIKEVHWHPQIPGMLGSTSSDGFHFFKTISV